MKNFLSILIFISSLSTPAFADRAENFAKTLPKSSWSLPVTAGHKHISYNYTFGKANEGGVFSFAINGMRKGYPFVSYNLLKRDLKWVKEVVETNKFKFDPNEVKEVVITKDEKGEAQNYLFIMNSNCMLDPFNVGDTEESCLKRKS